MVGLKSHGGMTPADDKLDLNQFLNEEDTNKAQKSDVGMTGPQNQYGDSTPAADVDISDSDSSPDNKNADSDDIPKED